MEKIKIFCSWAFDVNFYHEQKTELYVGYFPDTPKPRDVVRFVVLFEPPEISDMTNTAHEAHQKKYFDYLLTHQENLLESIQNSHMFEFGTCWIKDYSFPKKMFQISTLVGGKKMAEGHYLRHDVWNSEGEIRNIPTMFFNSNNYGNSLINNHIKPKIHNDKSPLFNSQFHICIENTKRKNWFTEKLIDCFQTKTIPIYYGCPNINKWFDTRGMFIVDNLNDIISTCNRLTPETYNQMLPFIEENYERSKEFIDISKRLENIISNILKNHFLTLS